MPKTKTRPKREQGTPEWESIAGGAARYGVSPDWIRRRIAAGELRIFRAGRIIRFRPADLDALFTTYGGDAA